MNCFKKIYILFATFIICSTAVAQGTHNVDDKPYHFGFLLGFNTMDFGLQSSDYEIDGKHYNDDVSNLKAGFTVGIISNLKLHRFWDFRFTPTLHLGERELTYKLSGENKTTSVSITSIPICFPFYLKYSAERYNNIRPYLIGGIGCYVDLGRNKEKAVLLRPFDVYFEVGMGCDIYFSFFKLAPELKVAFGNTNVLTPFSERDSGMLSEQDKFYSLGLQKLNSIMITLAFNFE
jgi:hypothetical protein